MKKYRKRILYLSIFLKIATSLIWAEECREGSACVRNFGFPHTFYADYSEHFSLFPPSFN